MPAPQQGYSPDNPFAPKGQTGGFSPDNPFAPKVGKKYTPSPTGHLGKPFVNAKPEEPSYANQVFGGIASLGRFAAEGAQTGARAVVREHGIADVLKELRDTNGGNVLKAMNAGVPALAGFLALRALERTPSYARAHEDIRGAEDSSGGVGQFNHAVGAAVSLAPLKAPLVGAVKGGMAPLIAKLRGSTMGKMGQGAWRGLTEAGTAAPVKNELPKDVQAALARMGVNPEKIAPARMVQPVQSAGAGKPSPLARYKAFVESARHPPEPLITPESTAAFQDKAVETLLPHRPVQFGPDVAESQFVPTKQSHRTAAQFRHFAEERMGAEPRATSGGPAPQPPRSALDQQLEDMLSKAQKANPQEVAATYGDAEEAQGLAPYQLQDLEALLRMSIKKGGGIPRVPVSSPYKP